MWNYKMCNKEVEMLNEACVILKKKYRIWYPDFGIWNAGSQREVRNTDFGKRNLECRIHNVEYGMCHTE